MRELNPLEGYPEPNERIVGERTIKHKIIASERGKDFYDGDRRCGYGGLRYDGRWSGVARNFSKQYNLDNRSSVLQINCDKGFLLHEFLLLYPAMRIRGTEVSRYARDTASKDIRLGIRLVPFTIIPFQDKEFDLVICMGAVYTLNLPDAIQCLKEIERVGKHSFVTLASYETKDDLELFRQWSLLGTTILRKEEWIEVLNHAGYTGDYRFVNAQTLRLRA